MVDSVKWAGVSTNRLSQINSNSKRPSLKAAYSKRSLYSPPCNDAVGECMKHTNFYQLDSGNKNVNASRSNNRSNPETMHPAGLGLERNNNIFLRPGAKGLHGAGRHYSIQSTSAGVYDALHADSCANGDLACETSSPVAGMSRKSRLTYRVNPNDLEKVFKTDMLITNKHTGRTELMSVRRPGNAGAEVPPSEFDPYVSKLRNSVGQKNKVNLAPSQLGYMPCEDAETVVSNNHSSGIYAQQKIQNQNGWLMPIEGTEAPRSRRAVVPAPWSEYIYSPYDPTRLTGGGKVERERSGNLVSEIVY